MEILLLNSTYELKWSPNLKIPNVNGICLEADLIRKNQEEITEIKFVKSFFNFNIVNIFINIIFSEILYFNIARNECMKNFKFS